MLFWILIFFFLIYVYISLAHACKEQTINHARGKYGKDKVTGQSIGDAVCEEGYSLDPLPYGTITCNDEGYWQPPVACLGKKH